VKEWGWAWAGVAMTASFTNQSTVPHLSCCLPLRMRTIASVCLLLLLLQPILLPGKSFQYQVSCWCEKYTSAAGVRGTFRTGIVHCSVC
jgi:hypothetical protein